MPRAVASWGVPCRHSPHRRRLAIAADGRRGLHCHRLCMVVDLLVAADIRIELDSQESLMRHFLALALTPPLLAPRMMQPAAKARLIAPACIAHALASRLPSAGIGAIPLSVIAAPADALLALTTRAIEHSVAGDDRTASSLPKAGQWRPIASLSLMGHALSTIGADSPKARGCTLGPSPFAQPGRTTAPAVRMHTRPVVSLEVERRNRIRSTKKMFRNRTEIPAKDSGCSSRCSPDWRGFYQPFTDPQGRCVGRERDPEREPVGRRSGCCQGVYREGAAASTTADSCLTDRPAEAERRN